MKFLEIRYFCLFIKDSYSYKQFIRLHSQPLLESLKESFERRYPQISFPEIPRRVNLSQNRTNTINFFKKGDFDLNEVKKSEYFFA